MGCDLKQVVLTANIYSFFPKLKKKNFLAVMGLCCSDWAFSSCGPRASLVVEPRL